jgi:sigma-B regulation protein RsbU (phosphoserine phosphatase)
MGAIVLVSEPTHQYNAGELKLLNTIALQVAPAIEIAQLHAIAIEKARMERELQMAREVQADLLPVRMPNREGWEFCAVWKPAREVSGDYYDFIEETNNQLGMVIADVSDKGLPAALMMVFARSALRASIGGRNTPTQAVAGANRLISSASHKGYFVTMVYARLDTQSGQICYVNAGHNPAIWYHKQNGRFNTFGRTGLPLGLSRQERYEQSIVQLNEGDFVLFYTDGVIDATDKNNQPFTTEHLNDVIYENRNSSAQEIVEAIAEVVGEHSGSDTLLDDVTMSIVKRL